MPDNGDRAVRGTPEQAEPGVVPTVGGYLRSWRSVRGLTQEQLGERAGLSVRAIRDLEKGRTRRPNRRSVESVAEVLGLTATDRAELIRVAYGPDLDDPVVMRPRGSVAQLPAHSAPFPLHRDVLSRLGDLLTAPAADSAGGVIAAVVGPPGVGKSTVLASVARRVADRFADGVLYADLGGYGPGQPLDERQALRRLLCALGFAAGEVPDSIVAAAALYRSALGERQLLVVLDNVGGVEQVRPLLAAAPRARWLIGSRHALTGLVIREGITRFTLEALAEPAAIGLFGLVIGDDRVTAELDMAAEAVRRCGCSPLAIRVLGESVRGRPELSLAELLAELSTGPWLDALEVVGDPSSSMRQALAWSYRALPASAARALRELAGFAEPEFGFAEAWRRLGGSASEARQALGRLLDAHLLEAAKPGVYRCNELVRCFAQELSAEEIR